MAADAIGVALALVSGCGAGLKHTIPDEEVRDASGELRAQIEHAQVAVSDADRALVESRAQRDAAVGALETTRAKAEAAAGEISTAERGLERNEEALKAALDAAKTKRDAAVAAAERTFEDETRAAKERHAGIEQSTSAKLQGAQRKREVADARAALDEAIVAERQARITLRDAELWLARSRYERAKLTAYIAAGKAKGEEAAELETRFDAQIKARKEAADSAREAVAAAALRSAETKAALDALLNAGK